MGDYLIKADRGANKKQYANGRPATQRANLENFACVICNMSSININRVDKDCTMIGKIAFHNSCLSKANARESIIKRFFETADTSKETIKKTAKDTIILYNILCKKNFQENGGLGKLIQILLNDIALLGMENIPAMNTIETALEIYYYLEYSRCDLSN